MKQSTLLNGNQGGSTAANNNNNNNNNGGVSQAVVSIDPGIVNCAVVRYDGTRDRFTHARLLNLLCTCRPEQRGCGALDLLLLPPGTPEAAAKEKPKRKRGRKRRSIQPTCHDFPAQLVKRIQQHRQGLFQDRGFVQLALERQAAVVTANMVVQSSLHTHYWDRTHLCDPDKVKAFWNRAAKAVGWPEPAFRKGTHTINKTDARTLGPCVLAPSELALLRSAAQAHHAHRRVCPVMQRKDRKRKREAGGGTPKLDDLYDAALQAIYAWQLYRDLEAECTTAPATQRLIQGRGRHVSRRILKSGSVKVPGKPAKRKRKTGKPARKKPKPFSS